MKAILKSNLPVQLTGFLFFSVLFIFSWVFYKERMLCFDPAFFLYKMIEYKDFSIELDRWGSAPSQLLPLFAIHKGFSLLTILRLYSVSFILLYYIFFLVITLVLKNNKAGIGLMLALCIGFRHAFYYSTAELFQGMALAFIAWAIFAPEKPYETSFKKWLGAVISIILIYIISYYHQLALFPVLFIVLVELIENKKLKDPAIISVAVFTLFWLIFRIFFLTDSEYEKSKMINAGIFFEQLPDLFNLPSTIYFVQFVRDNIFSFSVTIGVLVILFIVRKKWRLFLFSFVYFTGFLILILVTYYRGESPMMMEDYFVVPGCFIAVILIFLLYEKLSHLIVILVVLPLLIIHLKGIYDGHFTLTKRINYLERLISYGRTFDERKFLVNHQNFPWHYAWIKWAVPFETAILSSIESPDSTVTFFIPDNMNQYDSLLEKENIFLGPDWAVTWFSSNSADNRYFHLPSSGYLKLNTSQKDTVFNESDFNLDNVKIVPEKEIFCSDADSFTVVPVIIKNESGKKLLSITSGEKDVYLSYHLYDSTGKQILWDGLRTLPEVDILSSYKQGLFVELPGKKGEYEVEVDFLTEGVRWWGINSRFKLIVK